MALLTAIFGGFCVTPWEVVHLVLHLLYRLWAMSMGMLARGFRPLYPQWTLVMEVAYTIFRCCADVYGHRIVVPMHAKYIRWQTAWIGNVCGLFSNRFHKIQQTILFYNGLEHVWLRPSCAKCHPFGGTCESPKRLVVLYFHGGGYCVLSPRLYVPLCNSLASAIKKELKDQFQMDHVRIEVLVANYRKVPEVRFPVPAQDAVTMFRYLVDHEKFSPKEIIVAGDSAGGGLVLSTLLRLRESSPQDLPLAAITVCPFVDLSDPKRDASETKHCILASNMITVCLQTYTETYHDPSTWKDASPVHCDLRGLPPVFIQAAGLDHILDHSLRLAKKAEADGVKDWELDFHANMPHVFVVFPSIVLPYSSVGFQRMAAFAARHAGPMLTKPKAMEAPGPSAGA